MPGSTPLGLNPHQSKYVSYSLDLANVVPQEHADVADKQRAKDHTLLLLIWVSGDCFMERQYGVEHHGVRILLSAHALPDLRKLLELSEPCVLNGEMVLNRSLQGFL